MPYKKTYARKYNGKNNGRNNYRSLSRRVAMLGKIMSQQNELHTHDVAVSQSPDTSENFLHLTSIAQGDDIGTRTGDKITAKSLSYHLRLSAGDTYNIVRVVFLIDTAGVSLTPSSYLETVSDVLSFRSTDYNVGRYKVLMDRILKLDQADGTENRIISGTFDLKDMPINYLSAAAGVPTNNGIWLMTISDSGVVAHPAVVGNVRLRFLP